MTQFRSIVDESWDSDEVGDSSTSPKSGDDCTDDDLPAADQCVRRDLVRSVTAASIRATARSASSRALLTHSGGSAPALRVRAIWLTLLP